MTIVNQWDLQKLMRVLIKGKDERWNQIAKKQTSNQLKYWEDSLRKCKQDHRGKNLRLIVPRLSKMSHLMNQRAKGTNHAWFNNHINKMNLSKLDFDSEC